MTVTDLLQNINPEEYRFTNLGKFIEAASQTSLPKVEISDSDTDAIVILNGKLHSSPTFSGLEIEYCDGRTEIRLGKNTLLEHAIKVRYLNDDPTLGKSTIKVIAESNSKLCLIEESSGGVVSEIDFNLEAGARVEHLQLSTSSHFIHSQSLATLSKDSNYRNFIFNLEGSFTRRNVEIRLTEKGGHAESYCLYLVNKKEHSDIFTKIEHISADTTSEQLAKGILDGNSKGVFTGKIHIHPDAQRVNSSQLNKNLLLSRKAQAHSQPQLEIFADDVKCSHGSTTGQLSDDEIFYFESRGIPHEKARTLLSWAFAMEIVKKIKNREALELISKRVESELENKFKLKGVQ
jgi:Fe-S cluster assembly protein SufD